MGDSVPRDHKKWRLALAVISGPVIVIPFLNVDLALSLLPDWSGPLWLDAKTLIVEAAHAYWLTLMVAISLFIHRQLSPRDQARDGALYLPVLLWGLQSTVYVYMSFFYGPWQSGIVLYLIWLAGVVIFLVLGLVLLLLLPSVVILEGGRRVARIGLRTVALAGLVMATVFIDWTLVSTQATENIVVPALTSAAAESSCAAVQ